MKTLIICAFATALLTVLAAQDINVPGNVRTVFKNLYPDAVNVKWGKEDKDEFEAEFKLNGKSISVIIDEDGELGETETGIEISELPASAIGYIKANFKDYEITEAAKIVDEDDSVTFEAEISVNNKKQDVLFDSNGNHLKNHSKSGEEEEDAD